MLFIFLLNIMFYSCWAPLKQNSKFKSDDELINCEMEKKSCCSGRSCCPSTRAVRPVATPKEEPGVTVKTPKAEDVKPEIITEVEGHHATAAVKVERKEAGNVAAVKKEEAVKVNVGCGGGACN
ncbi:hypothetical protein DCAR_0518689 [Daucus carota subsp. sativus]|uniref:Uncharacterized protein n=1 Tax=Daucus carota subsp. sativus TaxID=79200 RepID=A0AAF0X2N3_DAUCS|nr:hypothetical protein DCAR_0518689 [Daucus carota subsp. sativus]